MLQRVKQSFSWLNIEYPKRVLLLSHNNAVHNRQLCNILPLMLCIKSISYFLELIRLRHLITLNVFHTTTTTLYQDIHKVFKFLILLNWSNLQVGWMIRWVFRRYDILFVYMHLQKFPLGLAPAKMSTFNLEWIGWI